ncbi:MAG TPA: gamma-glutamyl-gamma-aminobutyrate hydrolase family protein [Stellaceae bacterium]|nr:gamma-glutamyl-gamma-aminobutyrate hydrolase family protein [Stellaceae bacterium]
MPARSLPIIGIPACRRTINERVVHTVADKYPSAIIEATGCLPVSIPAIGSKIDIAAVLGRLDGLLLTGSPSNVHPSEYGREPLDAKILHDPDRDATTLPLIREAMRRDLPVFAICRGIQELNVALGGTLHQRLHAMPDRISHRPRKDSPEGPYGPVHSVRLTPGGLLASLIAADEIMVNSLHSQGIDEPAPGLRVEATAPDGQIEAVALPQARFILGVQWHPEYKVLENPVSTALFQAFGEACHSAAAGLARSMRAA